MLSISWWIEKPGTLNCCGASLPSRIGTPALCRAARMRIRLSMYTFAFSALNSGFWRRPATAFVHCSTYGRGRYFSSGRPVRDASVIGPRRVSHTTSVGTMAVPAFLVRVTSS